MINEKTLVLFSGGQDSTTILGWSLKNFKNVEAISFQYGQKHSIELKQAEIICKKHSVKLHTIDISFFSGIVDSALTSNGNVNEKHSRLKHLPASFVPNRNAMFITIAHSLAQKIGASSLITGVCETDFSGYPDCRKVFISSIQKSLNLGSDVNIRIITPLMYINKAETFKLAEDVGILSDVIELSHTCYNGNRETKHEWGYGCGKCPACQLREKGYLEYKKSNK